MKFGLKLFFALCAASATIGCGGSSSSEDDDPVTPTVREFYFEHTSYVEDGSSVQPALMVRMSNETVARRYDAAANPLSVTWSVGDSSVASVSATGVVTRKTFGSTTLTASTPFWSQPAATEIVFGETAAVPTGLAGEWMLSSWAGATSMSGKIYMELTDQNQFTLYQNIDTQGFRQFRGTYSLLGVEGTTVLLGSYDDGTPLQDDYKVEVEGDRLTLTAQLSGDVSVYERTTIPDWVKDGQTAAAAAAVRNRTKEAGSAARVPFL